MLKRSAESAADMEPVLLHAVVQSRAKTAEASTETEAARGLEVQLLGIVRTLPLSRTWRVQLPESGQGALVVLGDAATSADRGRFVRGAAALHTAGEMDGVLPVRRVASAGDAWLTDLTMTGTADDLRALSWPLRRQLEFVLRVVRALDALHQAGIVHGCLCSANVLLDDDLKPLLFEPGMVDVGSLASRGSGAEYLAFAAPEIKAGENAGARADVYSAGRLLQELTPRSCSEAIRALVARCTASDPNMRYGTAGELAAAIRAVLDGLPHEEPSPRPLPTHGIEPKAALKRDRPTRRGASERVTAPKRTDEREAARPRPVWLGVVGIVLAAGSFGAAAFLGASDDRLRSLLGGAAALGAALATMLLPPLPRAALLGRFVLALGVAALVPVLDPLAIAYRIAAQARMRGDDATRRAAIVDVMRSDRDFRGLSFAGASLPGVDLTAADLRQVSFAGADLTGANLYAAELYGASFADAELAGADLQGTQLHLADTSRARCDGATRLPPSWRCDGGRIGRTQPAGP